MAGMSNTPNDSINLTDSIVEKLSISIDHTLLKPEATPDQITTLCQEAKKYKFAAVCVRPEYVSLATSTLKGAPVKVATVVGFPTGVDPTASKVRETKEALENGAVEIDMVLQIEALKKKDYKTVLEDIQAVAEATHKKNAILKVILETGALIESEIIAGCTLSKAAGADYVKTSTGFGPGAATLEAVKLMRETVGPEMGVKASGGIRTRASAIAMLQAGATRLGTSAGVVIVEDQKN